MKVVILCGGKGTRLREETEFRPKPMLPIGNRPILWHIMKIYAAHGHTDFVLCLGYKGEMIKDYFRHYRWHLGDVTLRLGAAEEPYFHEPVVPGLAGDDESKWTITFAETGESSMTAYRLRLARRHLEPRATFLLTYGDGVGDVDVNRAIAHHKDGKKLCTLTAVRPPGRFGELVLAKDSTVTGFNEKPQTEAGRINGGFMVCEPGMFDYLPDDPGVMLEQEPMKNLTRDGQLGAYLHDGFWQPMDTFYEFNLLNQMWESGRAPWRNW